MPKEFEVSGTVYEFPESFSDEQVQSILTKQGVIKPPKPQGTRHGGGPVSPERQAEIWKGSGFDTPQPAAGGAARFLAAPVTGLLGIPGQIREFLSGSRQPSGGFLAEEPVSQAYGAGLMSLGAGFKETPKASQSAGFSGLPKLGKFPKFMIKLLPHGHWVTDAYEWMQKQSEAPPRIEAPSLPRPGSRNFPATETPRKFEASPPPKPGRAPEPEVPKRFEVRPPPKPQASPPAARKPVPPPPRGRLRGPAEEVPPVPGTPPEGPTATVAKSSAPPSQTEVGSPKDAGALAGLLKASKVTAAQAAEMEPGHWEFVAKGHGLPVPSELTVAEAIRQLKALEHAEAPTGLRAGSPRLKVNLKTAPRGL